MHEADTSKGLWAASARSIGKIYGSPRITEELRSREPSAGKNRTARTMYMKDQLSGNCYGVQTGYNKGKPPAGSTHHSGRGRQHQVAEAGALLTVPGI